MLMLQGILNRFFGYPVRENKIDLIDDAWSCVLEKLDVQSLLSCSLVSKRFDTLINGGRLWEKLQAREKLTCSLAPKQEFLCLQRIGIITDAWPFMTEVVRSIAPSKFLENVVLSEKTLVIKCRETRRGGDIVDLKLRKILGKTTIEYRRAHTFKREHISLDQKFIDYMTGLMSGDARGIFNKESENNSISIELDSY